MKSFRGRIKLAVCPICTDKFKLTARGNIARHKRFTDLNKPSLRNVVWCEGSGQPAEATS
jgi:hypothetical protein